MCKVLIQYKQNCRSVRHKIIDILSTNRHTDRQTDRFQYTSEKYCFGGNINENKTLHSTIPIFFLEELSHKIH